MAVDNVLSVPSYPLGTRLPKTANIQVEIRLTQAENGRLEVSDKNT